MSGVPKHIQIRNVPDDVHKVLTDRAKAAGQSLQEYLLAHLSAHAATRTNEEIYAQIERDRLKHPEWFTAVDAATVIREDRESH